MLKMFQVENYKGFKNQLLWDLSQTKDYAYCKDLVSNKIVKKALIFGKNGSGKSSLCTAVMDITAHLLDVEKDNVPPYIYTNVGNDRDYAMFTYVFQFGKDEVTYTYAKTNLTNLLLEVLAVNGKEIIMHNFLDEKDNFIKLKGAETLRTEGLPQRLSIIKYIYNNTIQGENSVITKIYEFVSGMLFFRSLKEANQYIGYKLGGELLHNIVLGNGKLEDFNQFLNEFELEYTLVPLKLQSGETTIGAKFDNGRVVEFESICSSGTRTLLLFYCWLLHFDKLTFLVIDEFDAYYHYETSEKILEMIHSFENLQSVVSTHSVTLMNTKLTRPDCCFILRNDSIKNICSCTDTELREAHNLEKMYRNGKFTE